MKLLPILYTHKQRASSVVFLFRVQHTYLVESTIYVGLAGFPRSLNSVKRSEEMSLTAKRPSHSLSTPLMCVDECVCVIEPLRDCFDAHLEVVFGFLFLIFLRPFFPINFFFPDTKNGPFISEEKTKIGENHKKKVATSWITRPRDQQQQQQQQENKRRRTGGVESEDGSLRNHTYLSVQYPTKKGKQQQQ